MPEALLVSRQPRFSATLTTAPVIVAKGKDLMAQRIKKIARDRGVPIIENVSLAQALFKGAEIGDSIPAPRASLLPTAPDNLRDMRLPSPQWWADNRQKVTERFNTWIIS